MVNSIQIFLHSLNKTKPMPPFKAAISRGANLIYPDTIEIVDRLVFFKKRRAYLVGYDKIVIPMSKVSSIEIDSGMISTTLTIRSIGEGIITGHNFTLSDANEIERLIQQNMV